MLRLCWKSLSFRKILTKQQSFSRSALIKHESINYNYFLNLHKGNTYDGYANIHFELEEVDRVIKQTDKYTTTTRIIWANIFLDFQGKTIHSLTINHHQINHDQIKQYFQDGKICLPYQFLHSTSTNIITISYTNHYDNDGNGCVSFIDVDQKQYLYTQFQPYFANRVFPLFDQPDLKATMKLQIACPKQWQAVLSNEFQNQNQIRQTNYSKNDLLANASLEQVVNTGKARQELQKDKEIFEAKIPNQYKINSFQKTKLLPSYLYCFVVGPYKQMIIQNSTIPMKLYSIESLYPELLKLAPAIQAVTKSSMNFFTKYFRYSYPFSKYDQVFAHEYKWGAMQNAGLVTLNDQYLFKTVVSQQKMLSFMNTIVHELAHHWFGNLVTMRWWDDLWLNESFAEYISHFCLQKIQKQIQHVVQYEDAMLSFYNRKGWGYREDEMITTHAIRSDVLNTQMAQSIFDGITYSKGAAIMKQLMYLIGENSFSQALSIYFHKYAFKNAILDDLLCEMQPYFDSTSHGINLKLWKEMWLERAGTNILSCQCNLNNNKFQILIRQKCVRQEHPTLRMHKIKIAMINADHSIKTHDILIYPQQTQTQIIPLSDTSGEPVAVILNYDDLTFAKTEIDSTSSQYFAQNLHMVSSSLNRSLVYKSYYEMVKYSTIDSKSYVQIILKLISKEVSHTIIQQQFGCIINAIKVYTPKQSREDIYELVYNFIQNYKKNCSFKNNNSNLIVILKEKLIEFAESRTAISDIYDWYYERNQELKDYVLDVTIRWKIVTKVIDSTYIQRNQKVAIYQHIKTLDTTDFAHNKTHQITAMLIQNDHTLLKTYEDLFQKTNLSITNFIYKIRGINSQNHRKSIKAWLDDRYFSDISKLLGKEQSIPNEQKWLVEGDFLESFIMYMDPIIEDDIVDLERKIKRFKEIEIVNNDKIKRNVLKKIDILQQRVKAYLLFSTTKVHLVN